MQDQEQHRAYSLDPRTWDSIKNESNFTSLVSFLEPFRQQPKYDFLWHQPPFVHNIRNLQRTKTNN